MGKLHRLGAVCEAARVAAGTILRQCGERLPAALPRSPRLWVAAFPLQVELLEERRMLASIAASDFQIQEGEAVTISQDVQRDYGSDTAAGGPYVVSIDWGDGTSQNLYQDQDYTSGSYDPIISLAVNHTYADNGQYNGTISIADDLGEDPDPEQQAGTASATFTVTASEITPTVTATGSGKVTAGTPYTLTLSASADTAADPLQHWFIDWGDNSDPDNDNAVGQTINTTARSLSVTHVYTQNGSYQVTSSATDHDGTYSPAQAVTATVTDGPIIGGQSALASSEGTATSLSATVEVNATKLAAFGGTMHFSGSIDWGDGTNPQTLGNIIQNSSSPAQLSLPHTYADDGTYTGALTLTDDDGVTSVKQFTATVTNVIPTLTLTGGGMVSEGTPYTLQLHATDPGQDTINQWTITWGDGGAPQTVNAGPNTTVTHVYGQQGRYTVGATARDEDGGPYSAAGTVTASILQGPAPTITSIATEGPGLEATNPVGLDFAYTDLGTDTHSIRVNWGDGTSEDVPEWDQVDYFAFRREHLYGDSGTYTGTVTVTDSDGLSTTAPFTSTVDNVEPTLSLVAANPIRRNARFTMYLKSYDPGDDHISGWDIDWGDGSDPDGDGHVGQHFGAVTVVSHYYTSVSNFSISAAATDEDGTYYTSGLTLDPNFATGGVSSSKLIPTGDHSPTANAVAVQPDGKIVAAGTINTSNDPDSPNSDFLVVRYNPNGTLDQTFGTAGFVTTDFAAGSGDVAKAVAIDASGNILVAGSSNTDFALARYDASGNLDTSFNTTGKVTTNFGSVDAACAMALQPDGKIVLAGMSLSKFALARYYADGTLDDGHLGGAGFSADGILTTDVGTGTDVANAVLIQPDHFIVAVGTSGTKFALARYDASGNLDTSFNTTGKVTTAFGSLNAQGVGAALDGNGNIVVAGVASGKFALARYLTTDGSLDASFAGGKITTDLGGSARANAVAVQADGKIVAAGHAAGKFALTRYNADGTLDATLGLGGKLVGFGTPAGGDGRAMAIQADGAFVLAGSTFSSTGTCFAVARYVPDNRAIVIGTPAPDNIVTDGNFEDPPLTGTATSTTYASGQTLGGWNAGGTQAGGGGAKLLKTGVASEGLQHVSLNTTLPGAVWQDLTTDAGHQYTLSFFMGVEPDVDHPEPKTLQVWWDGQLIDEPSITPPQDGGVSSDPSWQEFQYTLPAASTGTTRVEFRSTTQGSGPVIDDVSVTEETGVASDAPTNLTATVPSAGSPVSLAWDFVAGAGGYVVERSAGMGWITLATLDGDTNNWDDDAVTPGGTFSNGTYANRAYAYRVRAIKDSALGPPSLAATGQMPDGSNAGLVDRSFEATSLNGLAASPGAPNTAWAFDAGAYGLGSSGIAGNSSWWWPVGASAFPGDGAQTAYLRGSGSFAQTTTLTAGTYQLTFEAASVEKSSPNPEEFLVLVDGQIEGDFTPGNGYSAYATDAFTLAAGVHTIQFQGLADPSGSYGTAIVDNVQLRAASGSLVDDGGFEAPALASETLAYNGIQRFGNWWTTPNTVMQVSPSTPPPEGQQFLRLSNGGVFQDLPTVPGQTYSLSFDMMTGGQDGDSVSARVFWDGQLLDTPATQLHSGSQSWDKFQYTVTATQAVTRLEFYARPGMSSLISGLQTAAQIDDVQLTSTTGANLALDLPTGLTATATANGPFLSWTAVTGAGRYAVERSDHASIGWQVLTDSITTTAYQDTTASASQTYYYRVRTVKTGSTLPLLGIPSDIVKTPQAASGTALLEDQSFEQDVVDTGNYTSDPPTNTPWVFAPLRTIGAAGMSGVSFNGSIFAGSLPAPDGTHSAFIQGQESMWQIFVVSTAQAGGYHVSFQAAQANNYNPAQQDFEVLVDGSVVGEFDPAGTGWSPMATDSFWLAPGGHLLQFVGIDSAEASDVVLIDQVQMSQVPTPTAPVGLTATAFSAHRIDLAWTANLSNTDYVTVEMSTDGVNYTPIDRLPSAATTYSVDNLDPGTTYYFRVTSWNDAGQFASASKSVATANDIPYAPVDAEATVVSAHQINLTWWDMAGNESGFNIYGSTGGGFALLGTAPANAGGTPVSVTGLAAGTQYTFHVKAYNGLGESDFTEVTAKTLPVVPAAASMLNAVTMSGTEIDITWHDNATNEDGYHIYASSDTGPVLIHTMPLSEEGDSSNITYKVMGLMPGTLYDFDVKSFNAAGEGDSAIPLIAGDPQGSPPVPPSSEAATPLPAPTNLQAAPANEHDVNLTWNDNSDDEDGFEIDKSEGTLISTDPDEWEWSGWSVVDHFVPPNAQNYSVDAGLEPSHAYKFQVRAYRDTYSGSTNDAGRSGYAESEPAQLPGIDPNFSGMCLSVVSGGDYVINPNTGEPELVDVGGTPSNPAREEGEAIGVFWISPDVEIGADMTVYFALAGTAKEGADYQPMPRSATIVAKFDGEGNPQMPDPVPVVVHPIDDSKLEPGETVNLMLIATSQYMVMGGEGQAVTIADNESTDLTAYRTGLKFGEPVTEDTEDSHDPSRYLLLVNDDFEQHAPNGGDDLSVPTLSIPTSGDPATSGEDDDLAKITLHKVPSDIQLSTVTLSASIPAVMFFRDDGTPLDGIDLTGSFYSNTGYLAGLKDHDVTVWMEGASAAPDVQIQLVYDDWAAGYRPIDKPASDDVDAMVGDLVTVGKNGADEEPITSVPSVPLWQLLFLANHVPDTPPIPDEAYFKLRLEGVFASDVDTVSVHSTTVPSDGYDDAAGPIPNPGGTDEYESKDWSVIYQADPDVVLSNADRLLIHQQLGINVVHNDTAPTVNVATKPTPTSTGDAQRKAVPTPIAPPTAPTGVVVTSFTPTIASLTWNSVPNATSYRILQMDEDGLGWHAIRTITKPASTPSQSISIPKLVIMGKLYSFRVVAVNSAGEGWSIPVRLMTPFSPVLTMLPIKRVVFDTLVAEEATHSSNVYYTESHVDHFFDQEFAVMNKINYAIDPTLTNLKTPMKSKLGHFGGNKLALPTITPPPTGATVVHELVHALDAQPTAHWTRFAWNSEALAYGAERVLDAAKTAAPSLATLQREKASKFVTTPLRWYWQSAWNNFQAVDGTGAPWEAGIYGSTKLINANDLAFMQGKLGLAFSESSLTLPYKIILQQNGLTQTQLATMAPPTPLDPTFR